MLSALDDTGLRVEADIIYLCALAGISLPVAENMELWELAAAKGLHYTETLQEHNIREIDAEQSTYYEETLEKVGPSGLTRAELQERAAERRRERKARR